MSYNVAVIITFSILIPATFSIYRLKKISKIFYPFIYTLWLGSITEIMGFILEKEGYSNSTLYNLYVLAEANLLLFFFKRIIQPVEGKKKTFFYILILAVNIFWFYEILIVGAIHERAYNFRIYYSLNIVLMSINIISSFILSQNIVLYKNPIFLLTTAFIIYFTFKILIEAFAIYGVFRSNTFLYNLYVIMIYLNLTVNLIYTLAVLWMPKRVRFSLPS